MENTGFVIIAKRKCQLWRQQKNIIQSGEKMSKKEKFRRKELVNLPQISGRENSNFERSNNIIIASQTSEIGALQADWQGYCDELENS